MLCSICQICKFIISCDYFHSKHILFFGLIFDLYFSLPLRENLPVAYPVSPMGPTLFIILTKKIKDNLQF